MGALTHGEGADLYDLETGLWVGVTDLKGREQRVPTWSDSTGTALAPLDGGLPRYVAPSVGLNTTGAPYVTRALELADADRLLATLGTIGFKWTGGATIGPASLVTSAEAGMINTGSTLFAKLSGGGSQPYKTAVTIGAAVASTSLRGVYLQVKAPLRSGVSFIPLRVALLNTGGAKSLAAVVGVEADGQEHRIVVPVGRFAATGGYVIGTDDIASVSVSVVSPSSGGWNGLQSGEACYVGDVRLNPKGRAKAIIRFDDGLATLSRTTATFTGGPSAVSQAWTFKTLCDSYGFRANTFLLGRRIGLTQNSLAYATTAELQALKDAGWDNCVQTYTDPISSNNAGSRLLGSYGYSGLAQVASVSGSVLTFGANHNILTGSSIGLNTMPVVFVGTDLPAPLVSGVTYWLRYTAATTATVHSTETGADANTGQITLTSTGTPANFVCRFPGSVAGSSAIAADWQACADLLLSSGIGTAASVRALALNQGAFDIDVITALRTFNPSIVLGVAGSDGDDAGLCRNHILVGQDANSTTGSGTEIAGTWLSSAGAVTTEGGVSQAEIRAHVQEAARCGAICSNVHHQLTVSTGPLLNAYLDEVRLQVEAGAMDVVTVTELADYLAMFRPLERLPASLMP